MSRAQHKDRTKAEEMALIRAALGDEIEEIDILNFPPELRPGPEPVDHAALRASMPVLDPPLSRTIIDERDDRI